MSKGISICFLFSTIAFAMNGQGLTSVGAIITVENNASVTIQGDLENETASSIENSGTIFISNDIINNSGNSLFVNNLPGLVELNGGDQSIKGADSISFYDLSLLGMSNSTKSLFLDVGISNSLNLDNQELQLHQNIATVTNPSPNAVSFISGFVSGDSLGGYLIRATNQNNSYVFPVGDASLIPALRPVHLMPQSASVNTYGVRMSPMAGSVDQTGISYSGAAGPFDENSKEIEIGEINNLFYHNISRFSGSDPVDMEILYSSFDGDFKALSQWKSGEYVQAGFIKGNQSLYGLDQMMSKSEVNDFDHDVFVLSELNVDIKFPGGISINDDGINDILVIEGIEFYPDNVLQIFNRWGSIVYESVDYQNDWDGTSNQAGVLVNGKLPTGTYFYILTLAEDNILKGSLELKR